ncbi:MAG TPA: cephalosporin hydroxylase family protein [Saprospiraceae bacterium]|nr:cephalosporin hydroxylase family protein [Saprospiraceae bacterium]
MNPIQQFEEERRERIARNGSDTALIEAAGQFNVASNRSQYSYNFSWMGRPIIQYPQDMIAMQELIWQIRPDVIVETGIAHGGSLIFYASIFQLTGKGRVIGVDIDIREHNRNAIEQHPMYRHITMIQGSSVDAAVVDQVRQMIMPGEVVMVLLDSNHTHDHVIQEMKMYHDMVTPGSYLVVFDTIIEDMPRGMYDRPWDVGNNAKTAVIEFLHNHPEFEIDHEMDNKLLISVAPQGYLRRTK